MFAAPFEGGLMSVDRRSFLAALGAGAAGVAVFPGIGERHGSLLAAADLRPRPALEGLIRLDRNENPAGPFPSARRALAEAVIEAGRYPYGAESELATAIARFHGVQREQVVLGCGSGEILRLCTDRFTSQTRPLVAAHPTFETPGSFATQLERPVTRVPVTRNLELDLDAMAEASHGAGLVFLCNPNNPTGTVHGAEPVRSFLARVGRASPETMILVDEAYHEYVGDPTYASMVPETRDRRVIVSRTFSKVFGMAGMRVGYAIAAPETARILAQWRLTAGINQLAAAAARASLDDLEATRAEQDRNGSVRASVTRWFEERGFRGSASGTNFVFVDIGRDVQRVIADCFASGVAVGRPFPPLTTHLRVSIGTREEMDVALEVIGRVLQA